MPAPANVQYKTLRGTKIAADTALGIVEVFPSITGLVDEVDDIIEPGAYKRTLGVLTPKCIWDHDWTKWVGKILDTHEVPPGGSPLPLEVKALGGGALYSKVQFNLASKVGEEAFTQVDFYGEECGWSIGYGIPAGGAKIDTKTGVRRIKDIDLFEISPVLFGAMPLAQTLSVKSMRPAWAPARKLWAPGVDLSAAQRKRIADHHAAELKASEVGDGIGGMQAGVAGSGDMGMVAGPGSEGTANSMGAAQDMGPHDFVPAKTTTCADCGQKSSAHTPDDGHAFAPQDGAICQKCGAAYSDHPEDKAAGGLVIEVKGAVAKHSTGTDDGAWDGPAAEKNLPSPLPLDVAEQVYAWIDSSQVDAGELPKSAGKLPHHDVSADGKPGDANMAACSAAIGALNGGRGGADIPSGDVQGTYNHLADHMKDGGKEAPESKRSAPGRKAGADPAMVDCPTCKGKGTILEGNRKCPDCGGTGEVTEDEADKINGKRRGRKDVAPADAGYGADGQSLAPLHYLSASDIQDLDGTVTCPNCSTSFGVVSSDVPASSVPQDDESVQQFDDNGIVTCPGCGHTLALAPGSGGLTAGMGPTKGRPPVRGHKDSTDAYGVIVDGGDSGGRTGTGDTTVEDSVGQPAGHFLTPGMPQGDGTADPDGPPHVHVDMSVATPGVAVHLHSPGGDVVSLPINMGQGDWTSMTDPGGKARTARGRKDTGDGLTPGGGPDRRFTSTGDNDDPLQVVIALSSRTPGVQLAVQSTLGDVVNLPINLGDTSGGVAQGTAPGVTGSGDKGRRTKAGPGLPGSVGDVGSLAQLVAACDAALDQAVLSHANGDDLTAWALVVAAGTVIDEAMDAAGVEDPDDPDMGGSKARKPAKASPKQTKGYAPAGSYEEFQENVMAAARGNPLLDPRGGYGYIAATWPTHVVFCVYSSWDCWDADDDDIWYDVPVSVAADGTVTLGEPVEVEIETSYQPKAAARRAFSAKAAAIARRASDLKEGRVLSSALSDKIQSALNTLVEVLVAAGVDVTTPSSDDGGEKVLDEAELAEYLAFSDRLRTGL